MTEPIFTTLSDFTAAVAAEACDLTTSVTLLVGRIPPEAGDPRPALLDDLTKRANHPSNRYTPCSLTAEWWWTPIGDLCADLQFTPA